MADDNSPHDNDRSTDQPNLMDNLRPINVETIGALVHSHSWVTLRVDL